MRFYRRFAVHDYIVLGLVALGILSRLFLNPRPFIIPILVFGIIFLLYKFPPPRARSLFTSKRYANKRKREKERRKAAFRVISGNKRRDEDEPPRYH